MPGIVGAAAGWTIIKKRREEKENMGVTPLVLTYGQYEKGDKQKRGVKNLFIQISAMFFVFLYSFVSCFDIPDSVDNEMLFVESPFLSWVSVTPRKFPS